MSQIELGHVATTLTGGVATITFFHPAQNSLPSRLLTALTAAIDTAGRDPEVRVIVLASEGERAFCAGASFDELAAIRDFEAGKRFFSGFANVINAMRKCPKFIVGRVHGKAVGGGVGLAASTDYCMATIHASVKLSELAVGIGPFVVGPTCERKLGLSGFSELAINATEWRTAVWAKEKGLFNELFDTTAYMDDYLARFTTILAASSPDAMSALKRVCWQGTEHWDTLLTERAAISGQLVLSDFTRDAIASFKAKG